MDRRNFLERVGEAGAVAILGTVPGSAEAERNVDILAIDKAIPVHIDSQLRFRNFLKKNFPEGTDVRIGIQIGTYYCHYGELLLRGEKDPEVSNIGISDADFEIKMERLLKGTPQVLRDFLSP